MKISRIYWLLAPRQTRASEGFDFELDFYLVDIVGVETFHW